MNSIPCILIPILVGLICAVLGYLLGKMFGSSTTVDSGVKINGNSSLQIELDECRRKSAQLLADYNDLKALGSTNPKQMGFTETASIATTAFSADAAFKVLGKKIKQDDLKIVEGIGPKIEELFYNAGIKTWKALSETTIEKCNQILKDAGTRFAIHNAETWPKQAQLANDGKWQELKDWQNSLNGGKA